MSTEGNSSRCLDALIIALSQACEEGGKRWYTSTLELQRASLELCRACRKSLTLDGRDCRLCSTAQLIWCDTKFRKGSTNHTSKVRVASRVPDVRAVRLAWEVPTKALLRCAAIELRTSLEYLELRGAVSSAGCLQSVVWPEGLKEVVAEASVSHASQIRVGAVRWPTSLQKLSFFWVVLQPADHRGCVASLPPAAVIRT